MTINHLKKLISQTTHRNILDSLLEKYLPRLEGKALDIGSKNRRYDYLLRQKPIAVDIILNKENDVIFGDINFLPFKDTSFDSILAIEILEYVSAPQQAITEITRVLKKDGTLILSVPFLYPNHGDYIRFTEKYLKEILLNTFSEVKIIPIGNSLTIVDDIIRNNIFSIKNIFLKWFLLPIYFIFTLSISCIKMRCDAQGRYISGYFVIAKK